MNLEFDFVNYDNEIQEDLNFVVGMVAYFDCLECGFTLHFSKRYEPIPLHYQSLLRLCRPVTCPKCGNVHHHVRDEEGEDIVQLSELQPTDPNQLSLFEYNGLGLCDVVAFKAQKFK